MESDDIKDRVEMIVRPDFIVGQYFFIFMPWTAHRRRNAFFVDFSIEKHAWRAILSELKQTLAGTAWYHPKGRHHVVDHGKFTIRSRPEYPYHLAYQRESYSLQSRDRLRYRGHGILFTERQEWQRRENYLPTHTSIGIAAS